MNKQGRAANSANENPRVYTLEMLTKIENWLFAPSRRAAVRWISIVYLLEILSAVFLYGDDVPNVKWMDYSMVWYLWMSVLPDVGINDLPIWLAIIPSLFVLGLIFAPAVYGLKCLGTMFVLAHRAFKTVPDLDALYSRTQNGEQKGFDDDSD